HFYNSIGSLTYLKSELRKEGIYEFGSVKEIQEFIANFDARRNQIVEQNEQFVLHERTDLGERVGYKQQELDELREATLLSLQVEIDLWSQKSKDPESTTWAKFWAGVKSWYCRKRFHARLRAVVSAPELELAQMKERLNYLELHLNLAVRERSHSELATLDHTKHVVDSLSSLIAGCIGEQRVVRALEQLGPEYHVINDFTKSFSKALYNKQTGEYIQSIQLDHVVVGPTGVFLIETKHWSAETVKYGRAWSPVKQVQRGGYALFTLLNTDYGKGIVGRIQHRWGHVKIPVRNLLIMTNKMPSQEFQFVKVLSHQNLVSYIEYFKPVLGPEEVVKIKEGLME
ncbi:MAG: nuclease-related domain-containing protein, partial [Bacteroidia bacterium]